MLFELLAVVVHYFTVFIIRFRPVTSWLGLDMPYCWYALYGFWCVQSGLFVAGVWFAIRGWKRSPVAAGAALALGIVWATISMWLWLPTFL